MPWPTPLARSATAALGRTRALLLSSFAAGFEAQMEHEASAIAASGNGPEGREGIRAFTEKRKRIGRPPRMRATRTRGPT